MFNVILTKKDDTQYYVGCDCSIVVSYSNNNSFKYEFEDYEDAENVKNEFIENSRNNENIKYLEVIQM